MIKRINQLIVFLIFFLACFFIFTNKTQANCTDGILGTCQYDNQSCSYSSGHCSGPSNYRCCAPNCGQAGGNSCNTPKSGQSCTSLGRTYDCNPCYKCTASGGGSTPKPTSPPSKPSCGSWCAGQVGHASGSWCKCNSSTPDSGYVLVGCTTGGTSDCSTCCAFQPGSGGGGATPTPPPGCYTDGTTCKNSYQGTCGNYNSGNCNGAVITGKCPGGSDCVCCAPDCGDIGGQCCGSASVCSGYTTNLGATHDCPSGCWRNASGGGGNGGGDNSGKTCGQVCGEHGSTNGSSGCYCLHSSGSCPSPLVSYGASSDCTICCSWPSSITACPSGDGGYTPTPPPTPPPAPNPSCSISLTPSVIDVTTSSSETVTANVSVQNGSLSRVEFSVTDTNLAEANPTAVFNSPYRSLIYGRTKGATTLTAQAILSPSGSCWTNATINIESGGWFQTQGGDIYTGASLADNIPVTADIPGTENDRSLSLELDNWPGIISHQDINGVNLGSGFPSNNTAYHWLAESKYEGKTYGSFQFFKKKFAMELETPDYPQETGTISNVPGQDGVYYGLGNKTLDGNWTLTSNRWVVLLVEGDVNIDTNIIVPKGSFLAIAVTGDINFSDDVAQAQGMFIADGTIDTGEGDQTFAGQGVFAANSFALGRDFEDDRNDTTPIETFIARPDFIMSSYKNTNYNVWWFFQKWQELAP